ncbi:hypothetical protein ACLKA7_006992 [Drosophila subpalustris]
MASGSRLYCSIICGIFIDFEVHLRNDRRPWRIDHAKIDWIGLVSGQSGLYKRAVEEYEANGGMDSGAPKKRKKFVAKPAKKTKKESSEEDEEESE